MSLWRIVLTSAVLVHGTSAIPQSARSLDEAVQAIIEMSEGICLSAEKEGSINLLDLEGESSAELTVLSKRLAELGFDGAGRLMQQDFSNVLQSELADELKDIRRCREKVFDAMFATVFSGTPEVVLSESQQKTLEGRVRPHGLPIVNSGEIFALTPGETAAIATQTTIFSISEITDKNSTQGPYVNFVWTDAQSGRTQRSYVYQGSPIKITNGCTLVPFQIAVEEQLASFTTTCQ